MKYILNSYIVSFIVFIPYPLGLGIQFVFLVLIGILFIILLATILGKIGEFRHISKDNDKSQKFFADYVYLPIAQGTRLHDGTIARAGCYFAFDVINASGSTIAHSVSLDGQREHLITLAIATGIDPTYPRVRLLSTAEIRFPGTPGFIPHRVYTGILVNGTGNHYMGFLGLNVSPFHNSYVLPQYRVTTSGMPLQVDVSSRLRIRRIPRS